MNLITITYNADKWQLVPREVYDGAYSVFNEGVIEIQCFEMQRRFREDFKHRYARLIAEAPQPETLSPWLPIETAPKNRQMILIFCKEAWCVGIAWFSTDGQLHMLEPQACGFNPTHWMPLPAPPKPEQGK